MGSSSIIRKTTHHRLISVYKESPQLQRDEHFKSLLYSIFKYHTSTSQYLIVLTHFSWFQKSGELEDMFTFQMQLYFPNIVLTALETEALLSGSRPTSQYLNSIHKVLKEVQPLHIFALNSFAVVSAGKDYLIQAYIKLTYSALSCEDPTALAHALFCCVI